MKTITKLISLILGITLISCDKNEEPKPKTLQGIWSFSSANTNGEFTISLIAGKEKINQGYLDYIKTQTDLNVLIIDVSDLDFVKKQEDYVFLLNEINRKIVFARG